MGSMQASGFVHVPPCMRAGVLAPDSWPQSTSRVRRILFPMNASQVSPDADSSAEKPLAWVTGAGGLIGSHLLRLAPALAPDWNVVGLTREMLDLTDRDAVDRLFSWDRPQLIVHCAAMSRSAACQENISLARRINTDATVHLASLAFESGFVFLSSDLVFDGRRGHYVENDLVNPLSVYAETKADAERVVLANPRHLVIRTSLNGGVSPTGDRAFNEELRRAWSAGRKPRLFHDEYRSPIPASVTARAIWELVHHKAVGLFHVAGRERLSRYEIGRLLAARWPQLNPQIESASLREYTGPPRPPDTSLDCAKAQARLSFPLPGLTDWLAAHPDEVF